MVSCKNLQILVFETLKICATTNALACLRMQFFRQGYNFLPPTTINTSNTIRAETARQLVPFSSRKRNSEEVYLCPDGFLLLLLQLVTQEVRIVTSRITFCSCSSGCHTVMKGHSSFLCTETATLCPTTLALALIVSENQSCFGIKKTIKNHQATHPMCTHISPSQSHPHTLACTLHHPF